MCKVTEFLDGACDHYPHFSLSRSCRYGWSYSRHTCRGGKIEVVNSIVLDHPFCARCEREKEDSIRERYATIEREIVRQGNDENWQREDVEIALEICKIERKTKSDELRSQRKTSKDGLNVENSQTSELGSGDIAADGRQNSGNDKCSESHSDDSSSVEIIVHEGPVQPRAADDGQSPDGADLDSIIDAYYQDDGDGKSVTAALASMYG